MRRKKWRSEGWGNRIAEAAKWCASHRHALGMKQSECIAYVLKHGLPPKAQNTAK